MRKLDIDVEEVDPQSVADVPGETRRIGELVGRAKRAEEARQAPARSASPRRKRGVKSHPTRAADPRRRPHAVRVHAQLVGRRRRQAGRRAPADRGPEGLGRLREDLRRGRRRPRPGHHHRRPARQPARHRAAGEVLRGEPRVADDEGGQERPRLRRHRQLAPAGVHGRGTTRSATSRRSSSRTADAAMVLRPLVVTLVAAAAAVAAFCASLALGAVHVPLGDRARRAARAGGGRARCARSCTGLRLPRTRRRAGRRRVARARRARCCRARWPTRSRRRT